MEILIQFPFVGCNLFSSHIVALRTTIILFGNRDLARPCRKPTWKRLTWPAISNFALISFAVASLRTVAHWLEHARWRQQQAFHCSCTSTAWCMLSRTKKKNISSALGLSEATNSPDILLAGFESRLKWPEIDGTERNVVTWNELCASCSSRQPPVKLETSQHISIYKRRKSDVCASWKLRTGCRMGYRDWATDWLWVSGWGRPEEMYFMFVRYLCAHFSQHAHCTSAQPHTRKILPDMEYNFHDFFLSISSSIPFCNKHVLPSFFCSTFTCTWSDGTSI